MHIKLQASKQKTIKLMSLSYLYTALGTGSCLGLTLYFELYLFHSVQQSGSTKRYSKNSYTCFRKMNGPVITAVNSQVLTFKISSANSFEKDIFRFAGT